MNSTETLIPGWADRVAETLVERFGGEPQVVVTGISPSGNIHVGNLREVLVAEAVARALRARDVETRFIFHADTIDPLRKIAPGVPESFERYIGQSLSYVPDPEGCHESYAEHFLAPFERTLSEVGMEIEVLRSHELYEQGVYTEVTREALDHTDDLRHILQDVTGRMMPEGNKWSPYQPRDASGSLIGHRTIEHRSEENKVVFDNYDDNEEVADYSKGEGKLGWRVELAARWKALGVTFEPFGKDHTSRGGSTDTADRMAEKVFGVEIPGRYEYEWIQLKGVGAMSSSKGVVLLPADMLRIMPSEALRRMVLGRDPARGLDVDLASGFPQFMDEQRAELGGTGVPFTHLVTVSQTVGEDPEAAAEMLRRGGYEAAAREPDALAEELAYAREWAEEWAPEEYRFKVLESLPEEAESLDEDQRRYLAEAADRIPAGITAGDEVQNILYGAAKELGVKPKNAFAAIYTVLLGKKSGPKAGPFVASLPPELVRERFASAASASSAGYSGGTVKGDTESPGDTG
ncbi:lysine--tRNA ligase [Rubrobacter aplysinae]|uniref:lysine--tRNA ligase n=1 Tax=Rubrobacter aplysinae TaxID=909625 RepID=UPI00069DDAD5|nr:lysine--tRNA ligase [Rubrobacter aplysinae]